MHKKRWPESADLTIAEEGREAAPEQPSAYDQSNQVHSMPDAGISIGLCFAALMMCRGRRQGLMLLKAC